MHTTRSRRIDRKDDHRSRKEGSAYQEIPKTEVPRDWPCTKFQTCELCLQTCNLCACGKTSSNLTPLSSTGDQKIRNSSQSDEMVRDNSGDLEYL